MSLSLAVRSLVGTNLHLLFDLAIAQFTFSSVCVLEKVSLFKTWKLCYNRSFLQPSIRRDSALRLLNRGRFLSITTWARPRFWLRLWLLRAAPTTLFNEQADLCFMIWWTNLSCLIKAKTLKELAHFFLYYLCCPFLSHVLDRSERRWHAMTLETILVPRVRVVRLQCLDRRSL